jgi:transposase
MLSNAIRGHMAELGIIAAKGRNGTAELLKIIANEQDDRIPEAARFGHDVLARQYAAVRAEIVAIEKRIHAWHRSSEESRRLEEIPGVGPIVATALVAEVGDWKVFSSGSSLAAWIGLVPTHVQKKSGTRHCDCPLVHSPLHRHISKTAATK